MDTISYSHTLKNGLIVELKPGAFGMGYALAELLRQGGKDSDNLSFGADDCPYTAVGCDAMLAQLSSAKNGLSWLAFHGEQLLGYIALHPLSRRSAHRAELAICIAKPYWGCGLGNILMELALRQARDEDVLKQIILECDADNQSGIALYKKFGFMQYGYLPQATWYKGAYHDMLSMYLPI